MRAQKSGVIINVSSFLGKMGLPLLTHYNASKYTVEGITDSLRYEVAPFGTPVGVEAETLIPMVKQMSTETFEQKIKDTFSL